MGEKLELRLKSPVGAEPAVYPWPLPVYVSTTLAPLRPRLSPDPALRGARWGSTEQRNDAVPQARPATSLPACPPACPPACRGAQGRTPRLRKAPAPRLRPPVRGRDPGPSGPRWLANLPPRVSCPDVQGFFFAFLFSLFLFFSFCSLFFELSAGSALFLCPGASSPSPSPWFFVLLSAVCPPKLGRTGQTTGRTQAFLCRNKTGDWPGPAIGGFLSPISSDPRKMTGRAEIYKVVPGVDSGNAGRGVGAWASRPRVPCGGCRCRCPCAHSPAGPCAVCREGKRSGRHGRASLGRPFARLSCGARRGGGAGGMAGAGPPGDPAGKPVRPAPCTPWECVSFWKRRTRGGVGTLGPPGGWCLRFFLVSSLPCA